MLAIMLALLVGAVWWRGGLEDVLTATKASGTAGLQFLPILILAIAMMGFVEVLLPDDVVEKWLSEAAGWRGIGVAWLAGIVTPAGSLVGLPIAAGIAKAGAGAGVVVTYMVSFATLSLVRIPLELGIVGPKLTALRVLSCLFLPLLAGAIVHLATSLSSG